MNKMKKLGTVIHYECATAIKYIGIFYVIVFAVVSLLSAIVFVSSGNTDKIGTNALEMSSIIYVGVLGVLGFKEDFKMLIQNGFTRKYIFLSTFSLFAFASGFMALVDTIVGNVLHTLSGDYDSVFGGLYGYDHPVLMNWLWLFLVYMLVCCMFYLVILVINRIGKQASMLTGIALGLMIVLIIPVLFRFVLPGDVADQITESLVKVIGFMADGTINFIYPVLFLILAAGILSACSYCVIRKTELNV